MVQRYKSTLVLQWKLFESKSFKDELDINKLGGNERFLKSTNYLYDSSGHVIFSTPLEHLQCLFLIKQTPSKFSLVRWQTWEAYLENEYSLVKYRIV